MKTNAGLIAALVGQHGLRRERIQVQRLSACGPVLQSRPPAQYQLVARRVMRRFSMARQAVWLPERTSWINPANLAS